MRLTLRQLLIAVTFFAISFAAFRMSFFGIPVPLGSDTGRKATFVVSGVAFGAAIGLLTRRPIRFGIIGAFIGPFVLFFALLILVVVFAAGD